MKLKNIYNNSIGRTLCLLVIIICSMVLFSTGILIFALGLIPALCALPVLLTGYKLVQASRKLLNVMALVSKVQRFNPRWAKRGSTFDQMN